MVWTQTDLDAIKDAIASGELSVQFADRRVTYRSIAELLQAKAEIEREVNSAAGTLPVRQHLVNSVKGW